MPFGTVRESSEQRIKIEPEDGGGTLVEAGSRVWEFAARHRPGIGARVEFAVEPPTSRKALWVRLVEPPPVELPQPRPATPAGGPRSRAAEGKTSSPRGDARGGRPSDVVRPPRRTHDGFLNPYNFVRPLSPVGTPEASDGDVLLLGRCTPPPLDRYLGLSGTISCELTTMGPLFVSDSRHVQTEASRHRTYRFLRVPHPDRSGEEVPCIPASTLRGVVRSVFEAATNSCWEFVENAAVSRKQQVNGRWRRVPYRCTVHDRFPAVETMAPCSDANASTTGLPELCPACRVFGWVARDAGDADATLPGAGAPRRSTVAVRSRVRFGDALFYDESTGAPVELVQTPSTLLILSTPKLTAVRFYLMPTDGDVRCDKTVGSNRAVKGYDDPKLTVRGRKFYRRQGSTAPTVKKRSDQNRTLRDHMAAGKTARMEVRFDNLSAVELGALLWALELEKEWVHRAGFAKPLGFGNLAIAVRKLSFLSRDRWSPEDVESGAPDDAETEVWKQIFRDAMCRRYAPVAASGFAGLANIAGLADLLGADARLLVTYPLLPYQREAYVRGDLESSPESFKWFSKNDRPGGFGHWLDRADGDRGLPLEPTRP